MHCTVWEHSVWSHISYSLLCKTALSIAHNKNGTYTLAFLIIILHHYDVFLYRCAFSLMGNSATFLGLWASNEAYYWAVHIMWCCPPSYPFCYFCTAEKKITLPPPQVLWRIQRLIRFFSILNQKKSLSIILCRGNNYPPVCNEMWPGMATNLIRICYDPRNYKHVQIPHFDVLPVSEITKVQHVLCKHQMWICRNLWSSFEQL